PRCEACSMVEANSLTRNGKATDLNPRDHSLESRARQTQFTTPCGLAFRRKCCGNNTGQGPGALWQIGWLAPLIERPPCRPKCRAADDEKVPSASKNKFTGASVIRPCPGA